MGAALGSAEVLAAEGLAVWFPGQRRRQTIKAVDGVSFGVRERETFGVIGESGSGKSTVGRALVRLTNPTRGRVLYRGRDLSAIDSRELRDLRRRLQIVFQDASAALDPRMTILESVREPLEIFRRGSPAERERRALDFLERVALSPEMAGRYPHQLSGGQKQRANIARALVLEPDVLVCDEVVAALDVSIQADILNLFATLQREFGLTYVFVSHDLSVVSHISDRVAVMYFGKLVELGAAEDIMKAPLHPYTQALLSAEPVPAVASRRERIVLTGEIPSPLAPPSGCRFHGRCPVATELCVAMEPEWRQLEEGRWVACHLVTTANGETGATARAASTA